MHTNDTDIILKCYNIINYTTVSTDILISVVLRLAAPPQTKKFSLEKPVDLPNAKAIKPWATRHLFSSPNYGRQLQA